MEKVGQVEAGGCLVMEKENGCRENRGGQMNGRDMHDMRQTTTYTHTSQIYQPRTQACHHTRKTE